MEYNELNKRFAEIREDPKRCFKQESPARQVQLNRQAEGRRQLQAYLGLPLTYEKFETMGVE